MRDGWGTRRLLAGGGEQTTATANATTNAKAKANAGVLRSAQNDKGEDSSGLSVAPI